MTTPDRRLPVRRVEEYHVAPMQRDAWPATIPAIRRVLDDGLNLATVTVLVGENGSGKSTLVEAIALAYGLSPEGGSTGARHRTRPTESPLPEHLRLLRGPGSARWGYFLRAETMHGLFTYLEEHPGNGDQPFHELSHGESFAAMLNSRRFDDDGFFVMDEPEAGLSFTAQLGLLAVMIDIAQRGRSQILIATHSPILAAVPGAQLLELDEDGISPRAWADLSVVAQHRQFLDAPEQFIRHFIE